MNNPFDYTPDAACDKAFRELTKRIEEKKESDCPEDVSLCRELAAGKMLGVLVAEDCDGVRHTLFAFSGQLSDVGFHHSGFVGPVFDYLDSDGYFKTHEADISSQNIWIDRFEKEVLPGIRKEYEREEKRLRKEMDAYREKCRQSKVARQAKRESGLAGEEELDAMIRESQYEKAELHRLKKRLKAELEPFSVRLQEVESRLKTMKEKRRNDSEALQKWLFDSFQVLNARGESRSLSEIFAATTLKVPPSGAGECCAPKLLQAAYLRGWKPLSMAEYWYGAPKGGEVRIHGMHYPACRGKCLPVLGWMLQGLEVEPPLSDECQPGCTHEPEILFENEWFCVVNKPGGMLSVPGKGPAISVQSWLEKRYGLERQVKVAHRLDQDTSGLLVATFGPLAFKLMQKMFAFRQVKKTYVAVLEGDYEESGLPRQGTVQLPLSPDLLDRPRQRVDMADGKEAVTEYEFVGVSEGRSRILFHPHTGRTHQLRVHSASESGLGMPIVGDRLYGHRGGEASCRLYLHAHRIEFLFPIDRREYSFESPIPF